MGAGTLEGHELAIADASYEDAFVSAVDGNCASHGLQGGEIGHVDVNLCPVAEGGIAGVVFAAGKEEKQHEQ